MCQKTIITFDPIVSNGLIIYCTAVLSGAWKLKVRQIHLSLIKCPERGVERCLNMSLRELKYRRTLLVFMNKVWSASQGSAI